MALHQTTVRMSALNTPPIREYLDIQVERLGLACGVVLSLKLVGGKFRVLSSDSYT